MPFNLPIFLTWLRIVLIPLVVGIFFVPASFLSEPACSLIAAVTFVLAGLTDWFDGFLARRLNQISAFGSFLDPVADKLMVTAALLILVQLTRLDAVVALIIIGREIAIWALREWMARIGAAKSIAVNWLGKIKTACQMTAIPLLLYYREVNFTFLGANGRIDLRVWGTWLILVAACLTFGSMLYYLKLAWPSIRERVDA